MCTKKVAGGSKWRFPSFLTAVDKFLYTSFSMSYAAPCSVSSLIYSRVDGRDLLRIKTSSGVGSVH